MTRQEDAVRDVFDTWARSGRADRMAASHLRTAAGVVEAIAAGGGGRFLDLGCGNAWAAEVALAKGWRAVGVDVAPVMLAQARAKGVEAVRASLDALPFRDAAFAGAFSMEALYYVSDLTSALAETRRVCAPQGQVDVVVDRYQENPESHGWDEDLGVAMHLLSEAAWVDALSGAGFDKVEARRLRGGEGWQAEIGSLHLRAQ